MKRRKLINLVLAIVLISLFSVFALGSGESTETSSTTSSDTEQSQEIEYMECTVDQLVSELEENPLRAEKTYDKQYVKITGELSNIDSDGDYISLSPTSGSFTLTSVMCYIKNEDQLNTAIQMNKGDVVVVKGKIKSVGEVLGYSLDIDSFE